MLKRDSQLGFFDDIIVDNFAGGGGASTGLELATGHPVDIAINHDMSAILMHKRNHPYTEHYREDVWAIDPRTVTRGRRVRLAWFSPDCKHFSKAKGAALVDKHIRGLAWIVLRWAGLVRPDIIMLENVPEFVTWCPVRKSKPVKSKSGRTYRKWRSQLEALGYKVETRNLCAADYGAPTTRTRFCLIARCDGEPIIFPERTHAPRDSEEVKSGKCKPWRSAAEIIDWNLPCYSIFESKSQIKAEYGVNVVRPLKPNTLRRIAMGLDKFVLKAKEPFIVNMTAPTIVVNNFADKGASVVEPLPTITSGSKNYLSAVHLTQYFSGEGHYHDVKEPLATITTMEREGLVAAYLHKYFTGVDGGTLDKPLPTVTAIDHNSLAAVYLADFRGKDKGSSVAEPLMTVMACEKYAQVTVKMDKAVGANEYGRWNEIRRLLNEYCGYALSENEIILIGSGDEWYYLSDICLRMLSPRELYDAMGFPHDYVIDCDERGNRISRADQVARCGNAVCPPIAEAMARANLPTERLKQRVQTMKDLHAVMSV